MLVTDGPYIEGKEHIGGFTVIQAPDLDAALEWGRKVGPRDPDAADRSAADEAAPRRHRRVPSIPPEIGRVFRREYGRAVAVLIRAFGSIDVAEEAVQDAFATALEKWPAAGLPPSPAGWIITTARNRAIDRLRREVLARRPARSGRLLHAQREPDEEARRARRSTAPDLHVLPSGARDPRTGRADPASAGRPHDSGSRARVSRAGSDDGAAARAREEQDPRRAHSVSHPERGRASRAASRRARGDLSHLQ